MHHVSIFSGTGPLLAAVDDHASFGLGVDTVFKLVGEDDVHSEKFEIFEMRATLNLVVIKILSKCVSFDKLVELKTLSLRNSAALSP